MCHHAGMLMCVDLEVSGELFFWRGPAPWHFVAVSEPVAASIRDAAPGVSYGWGVIPVTATAGRTTWTTSLFPKDGSYLVPVKASVRAAEGLDLGDVVEMRLRLGWPGS